MSERQKVAVVTGASAGIGKEAARALLAKGWRVIGVGRDPVRCAETEKTLSATPGTNFHMIRADMMLLSETARVAQEIAALAPEIDALLNNAGGVHAERIITPEGNEATFVSNHLTPFLLTQKLMPQLQAAATRQGTGAVRIVATSSTGHEHCDGMRWNDLTFTDDFVGGAAYCHAKLANILFTRELARRTSGTGIVAHAMHPGVVASNFATHCDAPMRAYMESIADSALSPREAADTLVWLASTEEPGRSSGLYFHQRTAIMPSTAAQDDAAAARLWTVSEQLVAGY
ncbi:SDR family NAD(P)-dependent oxidoreductase [Sphingobium sp. BYY-5]|uniref:SDR family NAD(P)-dependent oxidoreductase n=1 Tax=Sphingobium sp. BYY-5 TaxID=2926400 RepID=UPI001FA7D368|nr:SDR family NAD(P)-dependent oxidoreductase [Sphingobium sp. BYY-5]MCI4592028.1 SDR family NAD(P)-dependent oxidoreductase [Sphingobium sp. BYY-5]